MFDQEKQQLLISLMSKAFALAANRLSAMTGVPFSLESTAVFEQPDHLDQWLFEQKEHFYTLRTDVKGEMEASSFLCLPIAQGGLLAEKVMGGKNDKEVIEGFLMELDNVLAAAVVTVLADAFGLRFFGHVPQMYQLNREELDAQIKALKIDLPVRLAVSTVLASGQMAVSAVFTWFFSDVFSKEIDKLHQKK